MTVIHAGVIGYPIAHSRSPLIHEFWLRQLGISGRYEKMEVKPELAETFIRSLPDSGLAGCNVTIPHKEIACRTVMHVSAKARRINSVNTIYVRDGATYGTSTDGEGYYQNVKSSVPGFEAKGRRTIVLGAGGSAAAIIGELIDQGCAHIDIVNRTYDRALALQERFGPKANAVESVNLDSLLETCDLLVNTTSQGMGTATGPKVRLEHLPKTAIVSDIVYVPLKTELIHRADALGLRTVTGLGMLLHQAVTGFELWFGVRPQVTPELHDLIADDIEMSSS